MCEYGLMREMFLEEYTLSKGWVTTNLYYAIVNHLDRLPIFIKSSKSPCRDTFWDAHILWEDNDVVRVVLYYRDGQIFEKLNLDNMEELIQTSNLNDEVEEYVNNLSIVCFKKFGINIVE